MIKRLAISATVFILVISYFAFMFFIFMSGTGIKWGTFEAGFWLSLVMVGGNFLAFFAVERVWRGHNK